MKELEYSILPTFDPCHNTAHNRTASAVAPNQCNQAYQYSSLVHVDDLTSAASKYERLALHCIGQSSYVSTPY